MRRRSDGKRAALRIPDIYTRSYFFRPGSRAKKIPDPGSGSASKILSIVKPKKFLPALWNKIRDVRPGLRIQISIFYPSRIQGWRRQRILDPNSYHSKITYRPRPSWIRLRIHGSMPLTNGSRFGSFYFRNWPSRCQQKSNIFFKVFLFNTFRRYIYIIFQR